jgi:hypothetical protein
MGAPRKHPPKNAAATIEKLAAEGHSQVGIAKHLGVGRIAFLRWLDEDETLKEAFEVGRETERFYLHSLIVKAAVVNKGANANAMFLLKARHGYRENDQQNVQVEVKVQNVMRVTDHGSDEEWAAKSAEQQRRLVIDAQGPTNIVPELPPPTFEQRAPLALATPARPIWAMLEEVAVPTAPVHTMPQNFQAPVWKPGA